MYDNDGNDRFHTGQGTFTNNYGCYCEGCSYACKRTNLSNNGPTCKLHSKVGHIRHYPFLSGTPSIPFRYGQDPDDFEYAMSEFLRMNGMYWGVACMDLIGRLHEMDRLAYKCYSHM